MTDNTKEIWVGLVGIYAGSQPDILKGAKYAYVNGIALVENHQSFCHSVTQALDRWGMRPFEFEDVEQLKERLTHFEVPAHILALANQTEVDGAVRFGEFFPYETQI
jgi:hypothetical protein